MSNVPSGESSDDSHHHMVDFSALLGVLASTWYCSSWVPWLRATTTAVLVIVVAVLVLVLAGHPGLPALSLR
jgi:hypothetical protein